MRRGEQQESEIPGASDAFVHTKLSNLLQPLQRRPLTFWACSSSTLKAASCCCRAAVSAPLSWVATFGPPLAPAGDMSGNTGTPAGTCGRHEHVPDHMGRDGYAGNAEGPLGLAAEAAGQNSAGLCRRLLKSPCAGCSGCLWRPTCSVLDTKHLVWRACPTLPRQAAPMWAQTFPTDSPGTDTAQGRPDVHCVAEQREELRAGPQLPVGRPSHMQARDKALLCRCSCDAG